MNSNVKVEANQQGELISKSPNNPKWGWIRVTQDRHMLQEDTGIIHMINVSALVMGTLSDLKKLRWKIDQTLPGTIYIKDSMKPFRYDSPEKDLKVAGKSYVICTVNGQFIYRKYLYSINPMTPDIIIEHDHTCKLKIKEAYSKLALFTNLKHHELSVENALEFNL